MKTDTLVPQELLWFLARSRPCFLKSNLRIWRSPEAQQQLPLKADFQWNLKTLQAMDELGKSLPSLLAVSINQTSFNDCAEKHEPAQRILIKDANDWCLPWSPVCFELTAQTFQNDLHLHPALKSMPHPDFNWTVSQTLVCVVDCLQSNTICIIKRSTAASAECMCYSVTATQNYNHICSLKYR